MKKLLTFMGAIVILFLTITTVNAMGNSNMSSVLANLTNKSEEEIKELREEKTYGEIAKDEDVYEEFKLARTNAKIARIDEKVAEGKLTFEEGEIFKARFLEKSQNCDGNRVEMNMGKGHRRGA